LKEEPVAFTAEQEKRIKEIASYEHLDLHARLAVCSDLLKAQADVYEGRWGNLAAHLELIKTKAKAWKKWPGE